MRAASSGPSHSTTFTHFTVLQILVVLEEVLNLLDQNARQVAIGLHAAVGTGGAGRPERRAPFRRCPSRPPHHQHPDRPAADDAARHDRRRPPPRHPPVAVLRQRVRDEAVIAGVIHRGVQGSGRPPWRPLRLSISYFTGTPPWGISISTLMSQGGFTPVLILLRSMAAGLRSGAKAEPDRTRLCATARPGWRIRPAGGRVSRGSTMSSIRNASAVREGRAHEGSSAARYRRAGRRDRRPFRGRT